MISTFKSRFMKIERKWESLGYSQHKRKKQN